MMKAATSWLVAFRFSCFGIDRSAKAAAHVFHRHSMQLTFASVTVHGDNQYSADGSRQLMPIAPKLALMAEVPDQKINRQQLAELNNESIDSAVEYYFARKISECSVA